MQEQSQAGSTGDAQQTPAQFNIQAIFEQLCAKIDQSNLDINEKLDQANSKIDQSNLEINNKLESTNLEITRNVKKELQEKFLEQDTKWCQILENFKVQTNEELEKMDEQLKRVTDICLETERVTNEKVSQVMDDLKTVRENVCEVRKEIEGELMKEVNEIRKEMKIVPQNNAEKINVMINPAMLRQDVDKKFYGDSKVNPKIFIKMLRTQIQNLGCDIDVKRHLRQSFAGDAELWFDIITDEFDNFDQFERIFLNYYWGQQTQGKFRENLYNGKYNDKFGTTREKYVLRKFSTAKQLDPPMSESDIIMHLARHFETEIGDMIIIHEIRDIERLLTYLRRIDDAKQTRKRYFTNNKNYNRRDDGYIDPNNRAMNKDQEYGQANFRRYNNDRDRNPGTKQENGRYQDRRTYYDGDKRYEERRNDNNNRQGKYTNYITQDNKKRNEGSGDNSKSPTRPNLTNKVNSDNNKTQKVQFEEIVQIHDVPSNQNF